MIKNIIFDLGNVIINYNQDKIINNFTIDEDEKIFIKEKIFKSLEWKLLDLGQITNNAAIEEIQKRNDIKYNKLINIFLHEWYKTQPINEDIVEIAKKLKERNYNIYVLSKNMAKETYEYFKNIDFFKVCNGIVISSHDSDGYYIVGELANNTSYPHCLQIPGGSCDDNDIMNGKINIFNTIQREVQEELNINLQDISQVEQYKIKYINLPSEKAHTVYLICKRYFKNEYERNGRTL